MLFECTRRKHISPNPTPGSARTFALVIYLHSLAIYSSDCRKTSCFIGCYNVIKWVLFTYWSVLPHAAQRILLILSFPVETCVNRPRIGLPHWKVFNLRYRRVPPCCLPLSTLEPVVAKLDLVLPEDRWTRLLHLDTRASNQKMLLIHFHLQDVVRDNTDMMGWAHRET